MRAIWGWLCCSPFLPAVLCQSFVLTDVWALTDVNRTQVLGQFELVVSITGGWCSTPQLKPRSHSASLVFSGERSAFALHVVAHYHAERNHRCHTDHAICGTPYALHLLMFTDRLE